MMITHLSKRVIPFRPHDAKRVGEGCFYLDQIVWLNGDRIELGDRVSFNYGCFVNGFGGLVFEDGANIGPYSMLHTANHNMDDPTCRWSTRAGRIPGRCGSGATAGSGWAGDPAGGADGRGLRGRGGECRHARPRAVHVAVGNPAKTIRKRR